MKPIHKSPLPGSAPVLITGGAGFIGSNLADRLLSSGQPVAIYDNLSRPGVEANLDWLYKKHGGLLTVTSADTRDRPLLEEAVARASAVFHFAAQVAVTSSLVSPEFDFDVNLRGTIHLLEALRALENPPSLVFTSTNKVYGSLSGVELRKKGDRHEPADPRIRAEGVGETEGLEFLSPYGCSKGAADQYVLDYARSFGLPALVFRMSCIYGPHQCGNEDQGWVAHFLRRTLQGVPITLYGDGRQVRDLLFVEDLVEALLLARANARALSGQAFNIGGGPAQTASLLELVELIAAIHGTRPRLEWEKWRVGDQRYYVSNFSKFQKATGWTPAISVREGVERLYGWISATTTPSHAAVP